MSNSIYVEFAGSWYAENAEKLKKAYDSTANGRDISAGVDFTQVWMSSLPGGNRRDEYVVSLLGRRTEVLVGLRNYFLLDPKVAFYQAMTVSAILYDAQPSVSPVLRIVEAGGEVPAIKRDVIAFLPQYDPQYLEAGFEDKVTLDLPEETQVEGLGFYQTVTFHLRLVEREKRLMLLVDMPNEIYENAKCCGYVGLYLGQYFRRVFPSIPVVIEVSPDLLMRAI